MIFWIHAGKGFRRRKFSGMVERVTDDVVFLKQFLLEVVGEVIERGPGICVLGIATVAGRRQLVGSEQTVACPSGVE